MWGHYLALVIVVTILIFPISWIYKLIHRHYGPADALVSLVILSIVIIILGIRGGNYAYKLHRFVRDESDRRTQGDGNRVVFEMFGIEFYQSESSHSNPAATPNETIQQHTQDDLDDLQDLISSGTRKRRGKQPRYPEDRIRRVVLRWERRDPSFSARTLEEFLEEEFGCGPDGVLLVPTSTFYDWRRNVLKEIEEKQRQTLTEIPS
jgi:hypothetical protein